MARHFVAFPTALWRDPSFAEMPWRAQRIYFLLCTQPELSQAGHIPLRARRWANMSANGSAEGVMAGLDALESAGWAWIDHNFAEVVLRPHTAPAGHKRLQGALQATLSITSPTLRNIATSFFVDAGHDSRREQRLSGSRAFSKMRVRVHERDGYSCTSCKWAPAIPEGYDGRYALGSVFLDGGDGQYRVRILELDHVYPEFLGGKFEFDNLQTLCNSCNASKGARIQ